MVLSCAGVDLFFGARQILRGVSFSLGFKEKAALVGVNGAGKTSLFRVILRELPKDGGEISLARGARLGYLSQNMDLDTERTIIEELLSVFAHLELLEQEIRALEQTMGAQSGAELERSMARYAKLTQEFEEGGGYEFRSRVRGVLAGLSFSATEHDLPIKHLSGGQKTRVALGKLLLAQPDLLLLDEPTNHLDIRATSWLEEYLTREFAGAVLVISHDRYFLDKVAKKVIEIEHGKAKTYNGNYSDFVLQKEKDFEIAMHHYKSQQKEIARQQQSIDLLRSFNREKSVKRARSKEKQLAKMERVEAPKSAPNAIRMALAPRTQSGNDVLKIEGGRKAFGEIALFENVNMEIRKGEKVALIGENGIGKTTLFKMILGGDPAVTLGKNVKIGYYDQTLRFDDMDKTIFNEISDSHPKLKNLEIRSVLAAFLFIGDDVFKPISALSGGERGRVALAKLMLSDVNFLLLDEPTNHLDLFSKEILENAINAYPGTLLYISHDRYLINNTADKLYELRADGSTLYLGNYDYYLEKRDVGAAAFNRPPPDTSQNKQAYLEQKEAQAKERQRKARIERLEAKIAEIEGAIAAQDEVLGRPEVATDAAAAQEAYFVKVELEEKLNKLLEEWEEML
ncbi:MAG: ABC-F family ATP-binding cassette domain-containing protein [Clostridiales bacterium]|nr:ABC-F family ATP-binding cassette domain-containing protein [Clostridiales bacterium]